jgi:hypothetical protein
MWSVAGDGLLQYFGKQLIIELLFNSYYKKYEIRRFFFSISQSVRFLPNLPLKLDQNKMYYYKFFILKRNIKFNK